MLMATSYGLSLVLIINIILTFTIIFLERKNPQSTYAWLLLLWMIPAAGFVFYLFFSQNLARRKIFKLNTEEKALTNSLIQRQKKDMAEDKIYFEEKSRERYKDLVYFHQNLSNALYTNNNKLKLFTDGKVKFDALMEDMKKAKHHIHFQYFIFKSGILATEIMEILKNKAKDGVEVRLLFDDMGGFFLNKKDMDDLLAAGVKVARFFPSKIKLINLKANYRNHRKIVVIDGNIGYIGGFNVGDEYLGLDKKKGYWRDSHLLIEGAAVYELQLRFIMDWRASSSDEIMITYEYMPEIPRAGRVGVQIVSSGPDDANEQIKQGYLKMINTAKSYIYIQTPYFVPDQSILEAVKIAAKSGVDVRIMIPDKPDHIFVYWATFSYVGELLKYGAKIYIYNNGFLHAKTVVVDDQISSVGTCNFDIRSFSLNFEVNAFIYDHDFSYHMKEVFIEDMKKSVRLNESRYEKRSIIIKIKESISRLFSPIL
ncbi:cardiolipin synthase [Alkalibacter saccharofermentans]|uniref:Cardiolipin synthase n=1 Tax=Alkalibacter saccharofermentans DSM 14828 TaxID=1120975 RepID=A0A1M4X084_9FIRM|nr:cardiolipin synthase [Alkalibacter saccharofermentans]SHE86733.1 cardiolipin synthase [Alkalibacter saccharofermentans DSM 14828]